MADWTPKDWAELIGIVLILLFQQLRRYGILNDRGLTENTAVTEKVLREVKK